MANRMGGKYRDQYFDRFFDYLRERSDKERKMEGKKLYSDVTIKTHATDTFYLEKHDDRDFLEWLKDEKTLKEAYECLLRNLSGRRAVESDAKYYLERMKEFRDFMGIK